MRRRLAAGVLAALLGLGCVSPPGSPRPEGPPLATGDPRPAQFLTRLRALAEQRRALRGRARVHLEGPAGRSSSRQLLLLQRPARLRVEVLGLLGQRLAILTSDGRSYALWQAPGRSLERGSVSPELLWRVAKLPLRPASAVRLLLAAPPIPEGPPLSAREDGDGGIRLRWSHASLDFDARGRLRGYRLRGESEGEPALEVHFDDYGDVAGTPFPRHLWLQAQSSRAELRFREVELNPQLPIGLFRLELPGSSPAPDAGGSAALGGGEGP